MFGRLDTNSVLDMERGQIFTRIVREQVGGGGRSDEGGVSSAG